MLERCAGQVRVRDGQVIGFDHGVFYETARALGMDEGIIAEYVPAAEAGMLKGIREHGDPNG